MSHGAPLFFIFGSLCLLASTLPAVIEHDDSADFVRAAAGFFILGSLMLW